MTLDYKKETRTVEYKAPMWVTDPTGNHSPRSINDIVNEGGWTVVKIHIAEDDKTTYILERPAAIGVLEKLARRLEGASSTQFDKVHGRSTRKEIKECPYCESTRLEDMRHNPGCPYGALMQIEVEARSLLADVTYPKRW